MVIKLHQCDGNIGGCTYSRGKWRMFHKNATFVVKNVDTKLKIQKKIEGVKENNCKVIKLQSKMRG